MPEWYFTPILLIIGMQTLAFAGRRTARAELRKKGASHNTEDFTGYQLARLLLDRKGLHKEKVNESIWQEKSFYDDQLHQMYLEKRSYHNKNLEATAIAGYMSYMVYYKQTIQRGWVRKLQSLIWITQITSMFTACLFFLISDKSGIWVSFYIYLATYFFNLFLNLGYYRMLAVYTLDDMQREGVIRPNEFKLISSLLSYFALHMTFCHIFPQTGYGSGK